MLRALEYLGLAVCCAVIGICLAYTKTTALWGTGHDSGDYLFLALMALSVICFWSCVKFIVINRRRTEVFILLLILVPMIFASLYVTCGYVAYLIETYHTIYAFNSRYLVQ